MEAILPGVCLPEIWQRCIADYLQYVFDKSESSKSRYMFRGMLANFFRFTGKSPDKITEQDVQAFIHRPSIGSGHRGQPPTAGTRNLRRSVLMSFYRFAANYPKPDGKPLLQTINPVGRIRPIQPGHRYRAFSEEEMDKFFAVIPQTVKGLRDRAIFLLYFWTSRRRDEIRSITWGDIWQGTIIEKEGSRQGYLYRFRGKGRGQEDEVHELPAPAYSAIVRYLEASGRLKTIQPGDPIFISSFHYPGDPLTPLSGDAIIRALKVYAGKAGLDVERLTVHSFRHTAVQRRLEAGQEIFDVMAVTSHRSLDAFYIYARRLTGVADPGARLLEEKYAHLSGG